MKQIVIISPLDAIEIFKQLGFATLVSGDVEEISNYVKTNIATTKVFIYDFGLKNIFQSIREKYKDSAFPIFVALALEKDKIEASLLEANRQIENAIGVKIE